MKSKWMAIIWIGLLALAPLQAEEETKNWFGEVGLLAGNHDNFFFRGGSAAAPSSAIFRVYVRGEVEKDVGRGELTVLGSTEFASVSDIDDADYQTVGGGVEYKQGRLKVGSYLDFLLNRLFVEEGAPVFFDATSEKFWLRYSVSSRLWLRASVKFEQWDFDPAEDGRDADVTKLGLTARYAFTDRIAARLSWVDDNRDANDPANDREGDGFSLALEAKPGDKVNLFVRFRSRDRQYLDAPIGSRNFSRDDSTDDVVINLDWRVRPAWGLVSQVQYRDNESTRADRNFEGTYTSLGAYYRF